MDRRIVFVVVFFFTLLSTVAVAGVCLLLGKTAFSTVLYSLLTMWVVGIVSQLLMHHLYQAIMKPKEEAREEEKASKKQTRINLDAIEEIDQVKKLAQSRSTGHREGGSVPFIL